MKARGDTGTQEEALSPRPPVTWALSVVHNDADVLKDPDSVKPQEYTDRTTSFSRSRSLGGERGKSRRCDEITDEGL